MPAYTIAELAGAAIAIGLIRSLYPDTDPEAAADIVVPREIPDEVPA